MSKVLSQKIEDLFPKISIENPSISLPQSGSAIRGIGKKFVIKPVTGTCSMPVIIATSSGRPGFDPQLSLSYNSGTGIGPFGFGWSLSLPSITRKSDKELLQYLHPFGFAKSRAGVCKGCGRHLGDALGLSTSFDLRCYKDITKQEVSK